MNETKQSKPKIHLDKEKIDQIRSWVVYKDDDIIVINKPQNLPVQGGTKIYESLVDYLVALQYEKDAPPALVHRLDQGASGILVLARDRKAAQSLQLSWSRHEVKKLYYAIVIGTPTKLSGSIYAKLAKMDFEGKEKVVVIDEDEIDDKISSKHSVTQYHTLGHISDVISLVALRPKTGRTHQLRVHCANILKTPILGDFKYGEGVPSTFLDILSDKEPGLHLHAKEIAFKHPKTNKLLHFQVPLPQHFINTMNDFGGIEYDNIASQYSVLTEEEKQLQKIQKFYFHKFKRNN